MMTVVLRGVVCKLAPSLSFIPLRSCVISTHFFQIKNNNIQPVQIPVASFKRKTEIIHAKLRYKCSGDLYRVSEGGSTLCM
jgi:hypothetical protein